MRKISIILSLLIVIFISKVSGQDLQDIESTITDEEEVYQKDSLSSDVIDISDDVNAEFDDEFPDSEVFGSTLEASLYPIPSIGDITLDVNDPETTKITFEIYDINGRRHIREVYEGTSVNEQLDLRDLQNGMYIGYIKTDKNKKDIKFIIQQ